MTLNFKLYENDYLIHLLYFASTSKQIKKKRKRSRILIPLIYLGFGAIIIYRDYSLFMLFFFLTFALLWYLFYPKLEKRQYTKQFKSFINENLKDRFGKIASVEISNDFIIAKDDGSEGKIQTTECESIIEISTHFFLKLKGGQTFILPKNQLNQIEELRNSLRSLASHLKIEFTNHPHWEWE